jgi:hypothetical protein
VNIEVDKPKKKSKELNKVPSGSSQVPNTPGKGPEIQSKAEKSLSKTKVAKEV